MAAAGVRAARAKWCQLEQGRNQGGDDRGSNRGTKQAPAHQGVLPAGGGGHLLRFAATLHTTGGLLTLTAELDTEPLARRVRTALTQLYGCPSDLQTDSVVGFLRRIGAGIFRQLPGRDDVGISTVVW